MKYIFPILVANTTLPYELINLILQYNFQSSPPTEEEIKMMNSLKQNIKIYALNKAIEKKPTYDCFRTADDIVYRPISVEIIESEIIGLPKKYHMNEIYYRGQASNIKFYIASCIACPSKAYNMSIEIPSSQDYMLFISQYKNDKSNIDDEDNKVKDADKNKITETTIYTAKILEDVYYYLVPLSKYVYNEINHVSPFVDSNDYGFNYITIDEFKVINPKCYNSMISNIISIPQWSKFKFVDARRSIGIDNSRYVGISTDERVEYITNRSHVEDITNRSHVEDMTIENDNEHEIITLLADSRFYGRYITAHHHGYIFRLSDGTWMTYDQGCGIYHHIFTAHSYKFYYNFYSILIDTSCGRGMFDISQIQLGNGTFKVGT